MQVIKRLLYALTLAAICIGAVSLVTMRMLTSREVKAAKVEYSKALVSLQRANAEYDLKHSRLLSLTTNTRAVELEIRSQFYMVAPGERIVLVDTPPAPEPSAPKK